MAGMRTITSAGSVTLGAANPGMAGLTTIHIETYAAPINVTARGVGSGGTYFACKVLNALDQAAVAAATIAAVGVYYVEGDLELRLTFPAGTTVYSVSQSVPG